MLVNRANYWPEANSWLCITLQAVINAKFQSAHTKDFVINGREQNKDIYYCLCDYDLLDKFINLR